MGGHMFASACAFYADKPGTLCNVRNTLITILNTSVCLVGSGQGQISSKFTKYGSINDLDFIVDYQDVTKFFSGTWDQNLSNSENLISLVQLKLKENNIISFKNGTRLSCLVPENKEHYQVDLFFTDNSDWLRYYYYDDPESKYKSAHRNIILRNWVKNLPYGGTGRYYLGDSGIDLMIQSNLGKNGKPIKTNTTLYRKTVMESWFGLHGWLGQLDQKIYSDDLDSFEKLLPKLRFFSRYENTMKDILIEFKNCPELEFPKELQ